MIFPVSKKKLPGSLGVFALALAIGSYIIFADGGRAATEPPKGGSPIFSGLVSRWDGDAVSGTTALDTQGGNNGAIRGGVTIRSWANGNNFHFDGSSGYIRMENAKNLNFGTGPFTLETWFRLGFQGRGIPPGNIIRKSNYPVEGPGYGYWLKAGGDNRVLEFYAGETTGIPGKPRGKITTTIDPDTWYHVIAIKDSAGTMKLYVNGELKGTAEAAGADTTSEAPFTLGAWDDRFGVKEPFFGVIAEVSVYGRALVKSEDPVAVALKKSDGPGGCRSASECRAYCENIDRIDVCLAFAEKSSLVTPEELKEMRQMAAAKKAGVPFPGNCKTKKSCLQYCEAPSHAVECVNFAEAAGFITGDEAAQAKKFAPLIARGETPGGCATQSQCEAYCEEGAHIEECTDFAIKYELFPPDELDIMKKIQPFVKAGTMPGGCKSKTQCEAYCESSDHAVECIDIGLAIGVIRPEEVEIIKKSGGKGPGNCHSREACDAFCSDPKNQKECMDFAVKIGLMTREEAEQAGSAGDMRQCFEEADDTVTACFVTNLGVSVFEQMKAGKMPHDMAIMEKMRKAKACVQQYSEQATGILGALLKAMPVADACVTSDFGPGFLERLKKGSVPCAQVKGMRGKMETCFQKGMNALFEPCVQRACNQVQRCMADVGKSLSAVSKRLEGAKREEGQKQELPPALQDKLKSCNIDINFDPNTCISKSTCKEFFSCINPGGNKANTEPPDESQGEAPPEFKARMDSCGQEIVESQMRECTDKPTCAEVNACLKAMQSGQSGDSKSGEGQQFKFPADIESRLKTCQQEEMQKKVDACLALSCSEFDACMKSLQGGGPAPSGQPQDQGTADPKITAKMQACQQAKVDACLALPCAQFDACMSALQQGGGGPAPSGQPQGTPDPKVMAKVQACQQEKVSACLALPCDAFQACINSLGSGGSGGGGGEQQGTPDPAVQAKFMSCFPPPPSGGG